MGSANPGKARSAARSASSAPALHISHPHLEQQISCTDPALGKSFGLVLDSKMLKKNQSKKQKLNQPNQMVLANVRSRVPPPGSWGRGVDAVRQPGCSSPASSRQTVTALSSGCSPRYPTPVQAPQCRSLSMGSVEIKVNSTWKMPRMGTATLQLPWLHKAVCNSTSG